MKQILTFLIFISCLKFSNAQFYNGLQNDFGKNRIQFQKFDWQFFRFEKFDVYFYTKGTELAKYVAESATTNLNSMESILDFTLDDRIEIIVYNKQSDFVQSNVGIGSTDANIGGTLKISGSKMFVYYDKDHKVIDSQIKAGLAQILINQWLFGGNWRDKVKSATVLNLPEWYLQGLVNYLATGWNNEVDDLTKDAFLSGKFRRFNNLSSNDAILAGHSIWNYIIETYGKEVIPNLIYMSQISRNVESGYMFVFGISLKTLITDWQQYYLNRYTSSQKNSSQIVFNKPKGFRKFKKNQHLTDIKFSPNGKFIAYSTNEIGRYKIYLYDIEKSKTKVIFKGGIKLERTNDYSFPLLTWHPSSQRFAFTYENKGDVVLSYYLTDTKELETRPPLFYFEKILSIDYMPDGKKFILSAVKNGQTDIFIYNIISNKIDNVTNDIYDDINPIVIRKTGKLIFASNRTSDSLNPILPYNRNFTKGNYDLYMFDLKSKQPTLVNISNSSSNEYSLQTFDSTRFSFLSSNGFVSDRYIATVDSGLAFVDTIEHYNFFANALQYSAYSRNILGQTFSPNIQKGIEWFNYNGRVKINLLDYDAIKISSSSNSTNIKTKSIVNQDAEKFNYLSGLKSILITKSQTNLRLQQKSAIDFNNYIFESEKLTQSPIKLENNSVLDIPQNVKNQKDEQTSSINQFKLPKQLNYFKYFTTDQVVSQFNNNFANNTYQKYTGGEVKFNPPFNGLFKVGLSDLFEDYRLVGGVRLSFDLKPVDIMLSIEDRHKRWDKQLTFYRQNVSNNQIALQPKTITHNISYLVKYPFNEVFAWQSTIASRIDRTTFYATDESTLLKKAEFDYWMSAKSELIFDNTRQRMINIHYGTRAKLFIEYFNKINKLNTNLGVIGLDIRNYQKIHKNIILASRFAASSSFGNKKLIYYLGAVDNWINFSKNPTFNNSVPISNDSSYAFQAVATNMRGFSQNIRNGNNFAVLNNEIRLPIFNTLYNRPLKSDFINNFQIIGFFDVGSAWIGRTPFSTKDEFSSDIIPTPKKGQISVTLISSRQPIVYGYGWGLRSRLFGYYLRLDWAWGRADEIKYPRIFYFSINTDF